MKLITGLELPVTSFRKSTPSITIVTRGSTSRSRPATTSSAADQDAVAVGVAVGAAGDLEADRRLGDRPSGPRLKYSGKRRKISSRISPRIAPRIPRRSASSGASRTTAAIRAASTAARVDRPLAVGLAVGAGDAKERGHLDREQLVARERQPAAEEQGRRVGVAGREAEEVDRVELQGHPRLGRRARGRRSPRRRRRRRRSARRDRRR